MGSPLTRKATERRSFLGRPLAARSTLRQGWDVRTAIILSVILTVASSINLWLVGQDARPPPWDYANYLIASLRMYNAVRQGSLSGFLRTFEDPYRPPLVPLAALPFYAMFGISYRSAMLANLVFIAILVFSTYGLAEKMLHSAWPALVAAGIICTIPGVIAYGRVYSLDLPTAALGAAGLYLTAACDGFRKRGISIALGAVVGLGMLTKWSYFVFVSPMIVAEIVQHRGNINTRNMILSGIAAAAMSSIWYVNALVQGLIHKLVHYAWGPGAQLYAPSGSLFDLSVLLYYPRALYTHLIGPFYAIGLASVFCLGLLRIIRRPFSGNSRLIKSVALSFLMSLLIFSLLEDKSARFFLPAVLVPVILLSWVGWETRMRQLKVGPFLLLGILVVGSVMSAVGTVDPPIGSRFGIYEPLTISDTYFGYNDYSPPKPYDWKLEQVITLLGTLRPDAWVGILACHWVFNQDTFTYSALLSGYDMLRFRDFRDDQVIPPYDDLLNYDFVLMKTGDVGTNQIGKLSRILEDLKDPENGFYREHQMIATYKLPDGSQAQLFVRSGFDHTSQPQAMRPPIVQVDHTPPAILVPKSHADICIFVVGRREAFIEPTRRAKMSGLTSKHAAEQ